MPEISVIIVTYNSEDTILACLESLTRQSRKDFEIILVDSNSKDNTKSLIEGFKREACRPVKTIYLAYNGGFCHGNNIALKNASGRYIALLNPDARAEDNWLEELVKGVEGDGNVGICASKILTWGSERIDSAGDVILTNFRAFKREAEDPRMYGEQELVFAACAAGALYKKEMIDEIGFFDEDFFIQCDDTDLSFRAQLGGWKVLYVPSAVVYHKVSSSIGKTSDIGVYYSQRNMEFLRVKNIPASVFLRYIPQVIAGFIADFLYFGIKHMKWRVFIKAKVDAVRMLPVMLEKRRQIKKEIKKVDNMYVRSLMTPFFGRYFFALKKQLNSKS